MLTLLVRAGVFLACHTDCIQVRRFGYITSRALELPAPGFF